MNKSQSSNKNSSNVLSSQVNVVSNELKNKEKPKSYFFQNFLIIILFTYLLVSFLTPKVNVDSANTNSKNITFQNKAIPSYFDVYGEKADKSFYSSYNRFTNINDVICNNFENNLRRFANSLASEKCTYSNCTTLIGYLAKDQVTGSSSGINYLNELFQSSINYKMNSFISEININMNGYQNEMQNISQQYAYEICTNLPTFSKLHFDKNKRFDTPDFKIALANLGLAGAFNSVAIVLDAGTLITTGFFSSLRKYIVEIAWVAFKGPIKKAAASVAVSLADGPLPIGDVIGVIGIAWTAYDISCMRQDFQNQVADSIYNRLYEEVNNVRDQSRNALSDIHANYQQIRLNMEIKFKKEYQHSGNQS